MIRAELLRLRCSLAARILLAAVAAEALFISLLFVALPAAVDGLISLNDVIPNATSADQFSDEQLTALSLAALPAQQIILDVLGNSGTGISFPSIAALLLGALTITTEHRYGSVTTTVLAEPRRGRVLRHKLTALALVTGAAALLLTVIRGGMLALGLAVQGEALLLDAGDIAGFAVRGVLTVVLYAWIGFAVGLLVRSPVAALVTLAAAIVLESIARPIALLLLGAPNPTQLLPLGLVPDISGTNPLAALNDAPMAEGIGTLPALLTLLVWALLAVSLGALRFCRTDLPAHS